MFKSSLYAGFRLVLASICVVMLAAPGFAQQAGGGDAGGGTGGATGGTGATGGGTTATGGGTGDAGVADFFNAEAAFDNIDRGAGIGTSTNTIGRNDSIGAAAGGGRGGLGGGIGGFGGGLGALGNLFGGFGAGGAQAAQPVIRTRIRSAISGPVVPATRVQQVANRRFQTMSTQPQLRGVNVTMQGRTAVISGVVASPRDRRMSELLMRLEPGVSRVDNRLTVAPQ